MNRAFRIIGTGYVAALALAVGAMLLGRPGVSVWFCGVASVVSGLVFGGHLVTLDDDSPGGWSNPAGTTAIWSSSLRQLALKFAALLLALGLLVAGLGGANRPARQTRFARPIATTTDRFAGFVSQPQPPPEKSDVKAPVPLYRVEPTIPMRLRVAGPLILKATIDERGDVRDVRIVRDGTLPPAGPAYVEAVKRWKFRPGTLRGRPVETEFEMTVLIHVR